MVDFNRAPDPENWVRDFRENSEEAKTASTEIQISWS